MWGAGQCHGNGAAPLPVTDFASHVATMAAGVDHTCAISAVGVTACWGDNALGQPGSAPFGAANPLFSTIGLVRCSLDVDGDGTVLATTDTVMMTRAALGVTGAPLTANAFSANAPRRSRADVSSFLRDSCGLP